jgi:hypothetical protein
MYIRCGEQFRRRYIESEKIPPGIALGRGSSLHKSNKVNLKQKISSGVDLPLDVLKDAARDEYVRTFREGGLYLPKEDRPYKKKLLNDGLNDALRCVEQYHEKVAPLIKPVSVEEKFTVDVGLDVPMIGIMDMEADDRIDDLKTADKKWPDGKIAKELQAVFYSFIHAYTTKKKVPFYYHILIARRGKDGNPTSADYQEQHMTFDDIAFSGLFHKVNMFQRGVKAGIFLSAESGSWLCNEKFCGYWPTCKYVGNSEQKKWT